VSEPLEEDAPERLPIGTVLEHRYRIDGALGDGGIGWVYRAQHLRLDQPVAIKMLQPQYLDHPQMRPRFEREAKALAALHHPNIVALSDYSIADGRPYLVMELLEGRTLSDLLDEGPIDEAIVRHVTLQVMDALVYAHEEGFVHRDLKPGNIFLCELPTDPHHVKVLDFGFVQLVTHEENESKALTHSGVAFGTPGYMSPEQSVGGEMLEDGVETDAEGRFVLGHLLQRGQALQVLAIALDSLLQTLKHQRFQNIVENPATQGTAERFNFLAWFSGFLGVENTGCRHPPRCA